MSFSFNFDVPKQIVNPDFAREKEGHNEKKDNAATSVSNVSSLLYYFIRNPNCSTVQLATCETQ